MQSHVWYPARFVRLPIAAKFNREHAVCTARMLVQLQSSQPPKKPADRSAFCIPTWGASLRCDSVAVDERVQDDVGGAEYPIAPDIQGTIAAIKRHGCARPD